MGTLWVQVYSTLPDHPKTTALAEALHLTSSKFDGNTVATGLLVRLWTWTIQMKPDGCLTGCSPKTIAQATRFRGKPDVLMNALLQTGWVDQEDDDLYLHDWEQYAELFIDKADKKKEANRLAQQACRARKKAKRLAEAAAAGTSLIPTEMMRAESPLVSAATTAQTENPLVATTATAQAGTPLVSTATSTQAGTQEVAARVEALEHKIDWLADLVASKLPQLVQAESGLVTDSVTQEPTKTEVSPSTEPKPVLVVTDPAQYQPQPDDNVMTVMTCHNDTAMTVMPCHTPTLPIPKPIPKTKKSSKKAAAKKIASSNLVTSETNDATMTSMTSATQAADLTDPHLQALSALQMFYESKFEQVLPQNIVNLRILPCLRQGMQPALIRKLIDRSSEDDIASPPGYLFQMLGYLQQDGILTVEAWQASRHCQKKGRKNDGSTEIVGKYTDEMLDGLVTRFGPETDEPIEASQYIDEMLDRLVTRFGPETDEPLAACRPDILAGIARFD